MEKFHTLSGELISYKTERKLFYRDNYFYSEDQSEKYFVSNNVAIFMPNKMDNISNQTAQSFSYEWNKFKDIISANQKIGREYFDLVDRSDINNKRVLDCGCGMGRWAKYLIENFNPQDLYCIDFSTAVFTAAEHLKKFQNSFVFQCDIYEMPFKDEYFDFIYSLGVLHHLSDIDKAFNILSKKLKKGGKLFIYMYYALDNRPFFYKLFFKPINLLRKFTIKMPYNFLLKFSNLFAIIIYIPFVYIGKLVEMIFGKKIASILPLEYYRDKNLQIIFNDCFDRLSAPLEKRFTQKEILVFFEKNGFKEVKVSQTLPYWKVIGVKE